MTGKTRNTLLLICCFLLLSACTNTRKSPPAPVGEMGISGVHGEEHHMVARGDTLYSIAWRYGADFKDIATWNGISSPFKIFAGQRLVVKQPVDESRDVVKSPTRAPVVRKSTKPQAKSKPNSSKTQHAKKSVHKATKQAARPARDKAPSGRGAVQWRWPTQGTILRTFSTRVTGRKGIDIGGKRGQTIQAAAAGKVVYSGSGLVGYGKLIIVKHNDKYLSAYGHNDALLVKQGHFVKAGQNIAKMGLSGQRAQLHFEIRRDGKPVNPQKYLPKH